MNTEQALGGIGQRIGARLLDGLVVGIVAVVGQVLIAVTDHAVLTIVGVVLVVAAVAVGIYNQVIRVGQRGDSIGKQALGLRVLDQDTGRPIGIGRALGREVVHGLLFAACWVPGIVNVVITAKDPRKQGWHDKAARSVVVAASASPAATGGSEERPAPAPAAQPPSLATDATSAGPYAPSAPPSVPSTAPPPPAPATDDQVPTETTVTSKPAATGMVGPPPGVAPPPPPRDAPVEHTVTPEPEEAEPAPPTPSRGTAVGAGQPTWRLTTPTGSSRTVDGLLLIGRDPDPELVDGAEAWAVDDPRLTMSKTHALLGLEDGTAWVEDWHSTNGVALHRGEAALVIEPHARTPLRDGDVIEFGAYKVDVEVER